METQQSNSIKVQLFNVAREEYIILLRRDNATPQGLAREEALLLAISTPQYLKFEELHDIWEATTEHKARLAAWDKWGELKANPSYYNNKHNKLQS